MFLFSGVGPPLQIVSDRLKTSHALRFDYPTGTLVLRISNSSPKTPLRALRCEAMETPVDSLETSLTTGDTRHGAS